MSQTQTSIEEKLVMLTKMGFTCGARDARLNRRFPGKFMVVEYHEESELPTEDGRNGPWCIVGDDLEELIDEAFNVWGDQE